MIDERSSKPGQTPPRARRVSRIGGSVLTLASVLGLLTIVASSCKTEPVPTEAPSLGANLELAAGEVTLVTDSGKTTLMSNTPLPIGARLETGVGARALVRLGDGTRVFMRDATSVTLGDSLALESGQVWIDAPPLEQGQRAGVHSIGAVSVAVSDGGASLSRTEGEVEVYVTEGLAIVTAPGGRTEVEPGERARISGAAAPEVEPVKFWDDWTGGMGDHTSAGDSPWIGTGSLYAIDHMAGGEALPLAIQRQTVEVAIDQQIAETEVEQVFFNPASGDVEGWYWFTVPDDAMIIGFALEVDGELVEGEVVERKQATQTYESAIVRRVDPALLEWIDARTVRARIYPIPGAGTRRVVLRYQQLLAENEGKLRYTYPMAAPVGREAATIEEFALEVQLRGEIAERYGVATRSDARFEADNNRVTMRRSGFTPRADFELELTRKQSAESKGGEPPPALRVDVHESPGDQADYVMLRWNPDVEFAAQAVPKGEVVVVVDTSAGSDPGEHQAKRAVAEALLRSLSADDEFVLVGADLGAEVLYPDEGMAKATPEAIAEALQRLAARGSGGATDLGAIFEQSLERVYGRTQPAIVYIGDGVATSGEVAGDAIADRLRRTLSSSPARLFTVAVGREVNDALLTRLAEVGGGRSLRVEDPDDAVLRALELSGELKTPTLTNLVVDAGEGLDDVFRSAEGKLSRGDELRILARTHYELPKTVKISFSFAGEDYVREYPVVRDKHGVLVSRLVPRLWANAYVQELLIDARGPEAVRGKVLTLGIEYGLMTPFTSFLALDSEAAYRRAGIERRRHDFPVLTADAAYSRVEPVSDERPSALSLIGAAASAPFGCVVAPDDRSSSGNARAEGPNQTRERGGDGDSRAQTRGSVPSVETPSDGDLDPTPEPEEAPLLVDQTVEGRRWSSLGVVKLDAESVDGLENDRAGRLAAAGYQVAAPPSWVAEVTESELARGAMSGRAQVLSSPVPRDQRAACSDASTRSLGHRRLLWARRLDRQTGMAGMLRVYEASNAACELQRWRDQQVFLDLLQARARTEAEIQLLLGHFGVDVDARLFLIQALLRRLIEPQLIAAVNYAAYGRIESWWEIDRRLDVTDDPDERLRILDAALTLSPGDPDGERRMLAELVSQGRSTDAITRGLRLRDQGQMTPELAIMVGELLVAAKREDAAKRLFSELVEFAPDNLGSRQLLGDIFMRHGWYEDAYRQYKLLLELTEATPEGPQVAIRMARAAASTDEALRLLGRVESGEGRPGEDDPRRFARFHSAAILAILIDENPELDRAKLEARLRALNLFDSPGTWELLLWKDFGASLTLASTSKRAIVQADAVNAGDTGLFARQYAGEPPELAVRHSGLVPDRPVAWERIRLVWDGEHFSVTRTKGTIEAKTARAVEPEPSEVEGDDATPG